MSEFNLFYTHGLKIFLPFSFPRLFAGVFPRVAAISLGGFIFLGAYERARSLLLQLGRERPRVGDGAPGTALKTGGAVQAAARREQGS